MDSGSETRQRRFAWRPLVRSLHRDAGYLAVGLTVIYALSGIAVNHIADWDPNFVSFRQVHQLPAPILGDDRAIVGSVTRSIEYRGLLGQPYRASPTELHVLREGGRLVINPRTGRVLEEGQRPRMLLRVSNWLHLNRGKKAWTLIADAYAVILLFLAISGLFMLPMRKALLGRGGLLVLLGIALPVLYVVLSGGP